MPEVPPPKISDSNSPLLLRGLSLFVRGLIYSLAFWSVYSLLYHPPWKPSSSDTEDKRTQASWKAYDEQQARAERAMAVSEEQQKRMDAVLTKQEELMRRFEKVIANWEKQEVPDDRSDVGGVKLHDTVSLGGQKLVLNGAGIRTKMMFKVYVGSLYVPAKASTAAAVYTKAPRRVQLNMLRDVTSDQMIEALVDGIKQANSAADWVALKAQTWDLAGIMQWVGPLKKGNVLTFDYVDGATTIGLNGDAKGSITGDAFNKALLNAWLGDNAIQSDLKKAMLGGGWLQQIRI